MNKLNQLTRAEMRKVMGGSGGNGGYTGEGCGGRTAAECADLDIMMLDTDGMSQDEINAATAIIVGNCNKYCSETRPV